MTHTTATALAIVLVAAGLAGCVGNDGGEAQTTTTAGEAQGTDVTGPASEQPTSSDVAVASNGTSARLAAVDCDEQLAFVPFPTGILDELLPPGMEPVPYEGTPGTITVFAFAFTCASTTINGTETGATTLMAGGLLVEPPPEHAGDVDAYGVVVEGHTDNRDWYRQLRKWDVTFDARDVTFDVFQTGPARIGEASAGAMQLTTAARGGEGSGPYVARLFGVSNDVVTGAVDIATGNASLAATGTATFFVDEQPPIPFPPGVSFHAEGADYGYVIEHIELADAADQGGDR